MKRSWYLCLFFIAVGMACSEDDEKPTTLTLEERILQPTTFSFYIRADASVGEGVAYFAITKESAGSLTISEVKNHPTGSNVRIKGGEFQLGSFLGLTSQTNYVVYAFLEVDGVASELSTMKITTP